MMKASKKWIYAKYGIEYKNGKILSPIGWITPLLINGNAKLGKGVYTFSTLAGTCFYNAIVNGEHVSIKGTCCCDCVGCYAKNGFYRMQSTINALAKRTIIAREYTGFMIRAICAQIEADKIRLCRIHAAGDFDSMNYIVAWYKIIESCKDTTFWTYTKNSAAEHAFDDLDNMNVVESLIHGFGYNFGTCEYLLKVYEHLKKSGKSVSVCKCGFDKNQHCNNCERCSKNDYVLFVEHGTAYRPESDSCFESLKAIANN